MHTGTGEIDNIANFKPSDLNDVVLLTPKMHEKLIGMNRKERREYYKRNRNEFEGMSWREVNGEVGE